VFHGFGEAKFADDGLILGSSQIYTTVPAASKNDTRFKSDQKFQNQPKNNHLAMLI
jgi:hypothetical protein